MKVSLGTVGDVKASGVPSTSGLPFLLMDTERPAGGRINVAFSLTVQISLTEVPSVTGLAGSLVILTNKIDGSAKKSNIANSLLATQD